MGSIKNNEKSVIVNGDNYGGILNNNSNDKYYSKNISLSVEDKENSIDWHEVKEIMFFRKDAKTNAGYKDPFVAAEEMLEFAEICYYEILEAEFVCKHKNDPVWLRVKILLNEVNVRRTEHGGRVEKRLDDDGCFVEREL